jgi:hypothetical protein
MSRTNAADHGILGLITVCITFFVLWFIGLCSNVQRFHELEEIAKTCDYRYETEIFWTAPTPNPITRERGPSFRNFDLAYRASHQEFEYLIGSNLVAENFADSVRVVLYTDCPYKDPEILLVLSNDK